MYPPMPPLRSDEALRAAGQDLAEWYYNTGTIGGATEDPLDRAYRFGWEPRTPKNTEVQLAIFLGEEITLRLALAGQMEDSYYDSVCETLLMPESTVMGVGASGPKKAYARPIVIYVDRPPFTS